MTESFKTVLGKDIVELTQLLQSEKRSKTKSQHGMNMDH